MVDIRLIGILAPPSQNVQQPDIAHSSSTNLPPIILRFPPGTILSGFIVNRDPAGNPILRTEGGDIAFETNLFLKIGSEVVIRIENRTGHPQAHILTVDGLPPEVTEGEPIVARLPADITGGTPFPAKAPLPETHIQPAATAQPPAPAVNVSSPSSVTGTLLTPTPSLPQGSQVTLTIVSITAAPSAPVPSQPPAVPQSSVTLYAAYARTAETISPQPPIQPAVATITPTVTTVPQTPIQPGQTVTATVIGSEPTGEALVQTPTGVIIRLQPGTALPQGSKITFEITQIASPAENAAVAKEPPVASLARQWTSLQQIFSLLSGHLAAPGLAPSGFEILTGMSSAPSPTQATVTPQSITGGLMLFITALRGGDFRGWLGKDNVKWLEDNDHGALVRKAEGEFMSIARQFSEAQPGQWQTLFFPVAAHGEVQQARLFVKRDRKQKGGNERDSGGEDTRFVIEMDLTQMGEMQMDGFVRRNEKNMEFDLFVRSHAPLEEAIQQEIFRIYNDMGELTGYKGHLLFQAVKLFPVNPMEETLTQHASDVRI